ncbi:MAG TPA: XdhC family protein, partial [Ferruginibacter sp.]|nr:XdhC family protein [Ferruginibacter sp.]
MNSWQFIVEEKKCGNKVVLLYVVQSAGSSPGRQGFKMAVSNNGKMCGSIGGGIMEHKFVEMAKEELKSGIEKISLHLQVHHKDAGQNRSGMICSGEQTLLICPVNSNDIEPIESLI